MLQIGSEDSVLFTHNALCCAQFVQASPELINLKYFQ